MAMAAGGLLKELCGETTCPICLEYFKDPVIIDCGHIFCQACITQCYGQSDTDTSCPQCRETIQAKNVKPIRQLANVVELVKKLQEGKRVEEKSGMCERHQEPLKLFCKDDEATICVVCDKAKEHRNHEVIPLEEAYEEYKALLEPYLGILEELLRDTTDDESYQRKEIAVLEKCTEDTLSHISNEFEVLHQILARKEQDIKKTVEEMKGENLERMEDALSFLEKATLSFTQLIAKVKAALETSDRIAFLKGFRELMDELKKYPQSREVSQEEAEENGICVKEEESDEKSEKATEHREEAKEGVEDDVEDEEDEDYDDYEDYVSDEDEDYVPDEDEEEESENDNVIPVEPILEEFKDSWNFQALKEMLEKIKATPSFMPPASAVGGSVGSPAHPSGLDIASSNGSKAKQ